MNILLLQFCHAHDYNNTVGGVCAVLNVFIFILEEREEEKNRRIISVYETKTPFRLPFPVNTHNIRIRVEVTSYWKQQNVYIYIFFYFFYLDI